MKSQNSDEHWYYQQQGTPGGGGYNGDYYETAFLNNKAIPCWSENFRVGQTTMQK